MDPLAQLKDIRLPATINNYPIAYGWWILLAIIIVIVAITTRALIRNKKKKHAQRLAIKSLSQPIDSNDEIIITLKWAAIQYFPRQIVAQLHGQQLMAFLLMHLPKKYHEKFTQLSEQSLNNRYQASEQVFDEKLLQAALLWLKHALPASKSLGRSGDSI